VFAQITQFDDALDDATPNPTSQRFEKMISGDFLGEIARLCLVHLEKEGALWTTGNTPPAGSILRKAWAFGAELVSQCVGCVSKNLDSINRLLQEKCGVESTLDDRKVVRRVAVMVGLRAARLSAMAISAVAAKIGAVDRIAASCHVGVDGSVYLHFPNFQQVRVCLLASLFRHFPHAWLTLCVCVCAQWMEEALIELDCPVKLVRSQDGSGQGAALIALGAMRQKRTAAAAAASGAGGDVGAGAGMSAARALDAGK